MRFLLFVLVYLGLYGGTHTWLWLKLRQVLALSPRGAFGLAVVFGALVLAPLAGALLERLRWESLARMLSWIGFTWMGVLFLFLSAYALISLGRAGAWMVTELLGRTGAPVLLPRAAVWAAVAVAGVATAYGWIEARWLRVEHVTITSPRVPPEASGFRVAQISDLHLGQIVRQARLRSVLRRLRSIRPDLVVSTGDLVDAQLDGCDHLAFDLAALRAPFGKWAVTGNHEFYPGLAQSTAFIRTAGFRLLRGESAAATPWLTLVGVDDPTALAFGTPSLPDGPALSAGIPKDRFVLLLKHRPTLKPEGEGWFDLQLSGHAHKGQIAPFNFFTRLAYRLHSGLYTLPYRGQVYVSRGTGTWGPPLRVLAPPEITVLELRHGPAPQENVPGRTGSKR